MVGRVVRIGPGPCGSDLRGRYWNELTLRSGTLRARQPSLGYEPYDVRLRCLGRSLICGLTSALVRPVVACGGVHLSGLSLSRLDV